MDAGQIGVPDRVVMGNRSLGSVKKPVSMSGQKKIWYGKRQ